MRVKNTIVSSLLCALLVLGFALSAQATITYQVQTSPLNAIKNGAAEVMGDVLLSVAASPLPTGIAVNDQITITYSQSAITPTQAGVPVVCAGGATTCVGTNGWSLTTSAAIPAYQVTVNSNVPSIGGTVTIRFTAAAAPAANEQIIVRGIRSSVIGRAISSIVITQFTAAPSGSSNFIVTSSPTVAFVVDNFSISGNPIVRVPICSPSGSMIFTVKEESLTTWVQYVTVGTAIAPTDGRSVVAPINLAAGGNANSWVYFVFNGLPTGVTANWPATVASNEFVNPAGTLKSALTLVSQATNGENALYSFTTPTQAGSDNTVETYTFPWTFTGGTPGGAQISVGLATPPNSIMSLQAKEQPADAAPFTALPRFGDPLRTAFDVVQFVDCVTNLLFPWVGSLPSFGYDTGIAVANTGYDVGAITPPTVGDPGVIKFYFYPQTFGAAPVAPTPVTTSVIVPGDTYATPFSAFGAQKFGYLIAVCDFRFGLGFAYITQGTIGGTLDTAQGYLALVLNTSGTSTARFYPESLGQ